MKPSVLVVDDEKTFRIVAEEALSAEGMEVATAASGEAALRAYRASPCDLVILDKNLPGMDGTRVLEEIIKEAKERGLDTAVIMATAYADVQSAVQAIKAGAHDYLAKPLQLPELLVTVRRALESRRLRSQVRQLTGQAQAARGQLVAGDSAAMKQVIEWVAKVAQAVDTTVLIQGESGTGKELVADLIHRQTQGRSEQPLVEINCASLPEQLLESELFGYERGAFTDAKTSKRGLFEVADGGTLFLDEVGETAPGTQAKLLKVLGDRTFRRLGGTKDLTVNVRVVAATNKDLAAEVKRGAFRLDLYHRLDVFHLRLPPLRDRRDDILPLARHFLRLFALPMQKPARTLAAATEKILLGYHFPGNVRELRNLIERAVILSSAAEVDPSCIVLSGTGAGQGSSAFFSIEPDAGGKPPTLDQLERAYIAKLLEHTQGNRTQVARLLGVSYPTVAKKISDYGL